MNDIKQKIFKNVIPISDLKDGQKGIVTFAIGYVHLVGETVTCTGDGWAVFRKFRPELYLSKENHILVVPV